ncbi:hypothetical protein DCCM_2407 [Desulfocucumis palustris]|uniref:Uncharacterized protein n=1 Tax=Desulfocucumis palustris TaxID=1898651 RepID=A0A2L2XAV5_9FIRM|nr:hypothetical protein DCCM_2407 [Desulfocucumis palustris]
MTGDGHGRQAASGARVASRSAWLITAGLLPWFIIAGNTESGFTGKLQCPCQNIAFTG